MFFSVVIAGRPNVGKSALFNRLMGRRQSLVHDLPGVTRDVLEGKATLDDGRAYRLRDTGGFDPEGRDEIPRAVTQGATQAIRQANLVLLVVDASAGVLSGDQKTARLIREAGVEAIVVANKIDRREGAEGEAEAWSLGFSELIGVSAEHNLGIDELKDAIAARMPSFAPSSAEASEGRPSTDAKASEGERSNNAEAWEGEASSAGEEPEEIENETREIALAVVGRPNVGKSSLVNALMGEERSIVSKVAGTTRDSVDAYLEHKGRTLRLIDTAGIRRKGKTEKGPEVLSVVQARRRIEDCDVALLVMDASGEIAAQDAHVASYVNDSGKGLVLLANKWDLAGRPGKEGDAAVKTLREAVEERIPFARHAPLLLVSAKTKRGIGQILDAVLAVAENRRRRIPTAELNRLLGRALRDKPPRTASGKTLKVLYVAQTGAAPPTFTLVASRQERLHFSEDRRIENILREGVDFTGSPIRISVRGKSQGRRKSGGPGAAGNARGRRKSAPSPGGRGPGPRRRDTGRGEGE